MSKRLLATLAGLLLVAGACSSADSESSDAAAETEEGAASEVSTDGDDGDGATATSEAEADAEEVELFSPTATDAPFDTSGGATSSDEGVTVLVDDPTGSLLPNVREATAPWTTDWTRRTVDPSELVLGIPRVDPRDAIAPIDVPKFEPLAVATWIDEREPGALVQIDDDVRFYPLSILTRHEIVNDRFGDIPVVISYCPLCNTAISFDARVDGEVLRFGVSGLLRKSDLVMWDGTTLTLWQQLTGEAIIGELAGTQLELIPTSIVSYGDALKAFPEALSLSRDTGFGVEYGRNGYLGYSSSTSPFLFDGEPDPRYPALSRVVGVTADDEEKAYPFQRIATELAVNDQVGETPVAVLWGGDTADALDAEAIADGAAIGTALAFDRRVGDQLLTLSSAGDDQFVDDETGTTWSLLGLGLDGPLAGEQLQTVTHRNEFWFAWAAFFPDAAVYAGS